MEAMWVKEEAIVVEIGRDTTSLFFRGLYKSKKIARTWGENRRDHQRRQEVTLC